MAEETVTTTPAPTAELTFDQQLEALGESVKTPVVETPAVEVAPPTETVEDLLSKIEEPKAEPEKPALTPEQQRITTLIPDVQTAEQLTATAQNYANFTGAFMNGDFENVEAMFEAWNKPAYEAFLEHVYERKVASGEWVDRWIADKEGSPVVNRQVDMLKRQLAQVQQQLQGRQQQELTERSQVQKQAAFAGYTKHVDSLFDHMKCPAEDRKWITSAINAEASKDQRVLSAIFSGNPSAINNIFRAVYKEYMHRDQATTQVKQGVTAAQEKHKLPLQSGNIATSTISDEQIASAPKGKRGELLDAKLDSDLAAFAAGLKGRR